MSSQSPFAQLRAFTLVELLVVIAVIALLISILLPSLSRARKQGRQLQCLTNEASIGKAALFYAQEFKGWVIGSEYEERFAPRPGSPKGYPRDDSYAHTHFAISLLNGLLSNHAIKGLYDSTRQAAMIKACGEIPQLQCPEFPNPKQKLDYIVNAFLQDYTEDNVRRDEQHGMQYRKRDNVQIEDTQEASYFHHIDRLNVSPSRRAYVLEAAKQHATDDLRLHDAFYATHLPFASNARIQNDPRHPKGTNVLFFDGHADRMDFNRLDEGYPNSFGVRLRWFTTVPEKYR